MTSGVAHIPDLDTFAARARQEAGLDDFGNPWIFENLDALIPLLKSEAQLTEIGATGAQAMIVNALVNRLRHVDLIKQHPEILDEQVDVAAVVVGLPRTGSTMLHRMLSAAPGMTGVKWWESQNYAPFPGEAPGDFGARRAAASVHLGHMLELAPELMSIHPMSVDQSDEELVILGLLFSSTMIEGTYHVPSYARWLIEHSRTRCYADLKEILQSLQWQDKNRNGAKWVLKTPGHLMALDAVIETFPGAKVVMTHRDPITTVPSFCSMMATLYGMSSTIDNRQTGLFWEQRLAELLRLFMAMRATAGSGHFIDVRYDDLTARPIEEGKRVLAEAGIAATPEIVAGMEKWIEANRREDRAPHRYALKDFDLTHAQIERDFADYRADFIPRVPPDRGALK